MICQKVNWAKTRYVVLGSCPVAYRLFERIQVDFTDLPKVERYKFLLVIVDKLTHCVEALPSSWAMAQTISRFLLEEILPRYKLVRYIDSDQGTFFISEIIRQVANTLGIQWEYHIP